MKRLTKKNDQNTTGNNFQIPLVSLSNQSESQKNEMMDQLQTHFKNEFNGNQVQNNMTLPVIMTDEMLRQNKSKKSSESSSSSSSSSSKSSNSKGSQKQVVPHTHKHSDSSCTSEHTHNHTPDMTYNEVQLLNQVEQRSPHVHKHSDSSCTSDHTHNHTPVNNQMKDVLSSENTSQLYEEQRNQSILDQRQNNLLVHKDYDEDLSSNQIENNLKIATAQAIHNRFHHGSAEHNKVYVDQKLTGLKNNSIEHSLSTSQHGLIKFVNPIHEYKQNSQIDLNDSQVFKVTHSSEISSSKNQSVEQRSPHVHKHSDSSCTSDHTHNHTPVITYNEMQLLNQVEQRSPHVHKHSDSSCTSDHTHNHTPLVHDQEIRQESESENSLYNVTHSSSIRTNSSSREFYEQKQNESQNGSTLTCFVFFCAGGSVTCSASLLFLRTECCCFCFSSDPVYF